MKQLLHLVICFSIFFTNSELFAQTVVWNSSVNQIEDDLYQIVIDASIPSGWHIYNIEQYGEGGPNSTIITFPTIEGVKYESDVVEIEMPICKYDSIMQMEVCYFENKASFSRNIRLISEGAEIPIGIEWTLCGDTFCFSPAECELIVSVGNETLSMQSADSFSNEGGSNFLWKMVLEAILWGFAALLTPCVFPIVPLTVSFFLKKSGNKKTGRLRALMYGCFIVLLYTLPITIIILLTRIIGGTIVTANTFNWLSTHWLPNVIFFIVFVIFAISLFGLFDIVLPSKIVNKIHSQSLRGGGLGALFFMALTLVVVSFSCTGPIVGTVLIKSVAGEFIAPIITMLAFSIAFATPFTLFAFFPSWLNALHRSGNWLNTVKVAMGFVELALGLKFLSVADQTYHWGILGRDIYLVLWIIIFSALGFYLLGKLKFGQNSNIVNSKPSTTRLSFSLITFAFVFYLLMGLFGLPLKAISGYLPPINSSEKHRFATLFQTKQPNENHSAISSNIKYGDILSLPYNINGFFDIYQAEEYAAAVNKPLFIDFTGHGCVNCREMEIRVLSNQRILDILQNNYVVVALYADDRTVVDEYDWMVTKQGKTLKRLGQINSEIAFARYGVNAQPYYILQGKNGKILAEPRSYNLNTEEFIDFLERGIEAYNHE